MPENASSELRAVVLDAEPGEDGFVRFVDAGAHADGEFQCADCGYGVTVHGRLPSCPMCAGDTWEQSPWSPIARAAGNPL